MPPNPLTVQASPWDGGRLGQCYDNVCERIRVRGGEPVFGWVLREYGPIRTRGSYPPPLYRRWVKHVVWRDPLEKLWEVSPSVSPENDAEIVFLDCEFLPDSSVSVGRTTPKEWFQTGIRYVAVREEGKDVAEYLTLAQQAQSHEETVNWVQRAISAVGAAGFEPSKGIIESIGGNTTSISIYAD